MGGKSGPKESRASVAQAEIAKKLFEQSNPLREAIVGLNEDFLGVGQPAAPVPALPSPVSSLPGAPIPEEIRQQRTQDFRNQLMKGEQGLADLSLQHIENLSAPLTPQETQNLTPGTPGATRPKMSFSNIDPSVLPQFQVGKNIIEKQAQRGKESAIASGASGGALADLMLRAETGRARDLGVLGSELTQQQLNQALGIATGGVGQAQTGLSSVMAAQAQKAAAQSQANAAKGQGAGALTSAALKSGGGKGGGSTAATAATAATSDRRLKRNIKPFAKINGHQFYTYNLLDTDTELSGVMADEVEHVPDAVFELNNIKHVNYGALL